MYDSVADVIPADPQAVLGYRDGNWPNYDTLCSRFPRAEHLGLTVNGSTADADGCDVENGDLAPASGAAWTLRRRQLTPGFPPVVYCQVSSVAAVLVALAAVGVARDDVRLLTAHYGRGEHICSPACWPGLPTTADGTQWLEGGPGLPQAYDQSALVDTFFAAAAAKPPLAPPEEPAVINIIAHDRLHLFNVTPSGQLVWRAHASGAGFQTSVSRPGGFPIFAA